MDNTLTDAKTKEMMPKQKMGLLPSVTSLGDGLPSRAGSQRDEAKWQVSTLSKT